MTYVIYSENIIVTTAYTIHAHNIYIYYTYKIHIYNVGSAVRWRRRHSSSPVLRVVPAARPFQQPSEPLHVSSPSDALVLYAGRVYFYFYYCLVAYFKLSFISFNFIFILTCIIFVNHFYVRVCICVFVWEVRV